MRALRILAVNNFKSWFLEVPENKCSDLCISKVPKYVEVKKATFQMITHIHERECSASVFVIYTK